MGSFEATRIYRLTTSRGLQQKKLFTNWINAQLNQANTETFLEPILYKKLTDGFNGDLAETGITYLFKREPIFQSVNDLYTDLSDGRVLLRLLEIFTGKKMNLARGSMRVHNLENVNRALKFLKQMHIHLENIGPIDIVDGNASLILGLIWTLILHFQLRQLSNLPPPHKDSECDAKNTLLRWCQLKTANYRQISVRNFTSSWKDGRALCALLYRHRLDLIDLDTLINSPQDSISPLERMTEAFRIAAEEFQIPPLISPTDFAACCSDERCVVAVVATWYQHLNKSRVVTRSTTRLAGVLQRAMAMNRKWVVYAKEVHRLRGWIQANVSLISGMLREEDDYYDGDDDDDAHAVEDEVEETLQALRRWQREEKATKVSEMEKLELSWVKLKIESLGAGYRNPALPTGYSLDGVQKYWMKLEVAERICEGRLRQMMVQTVNRIQLNLKLRKKIELHRRWLADNNRLIELAAKSDLAHQETLRQSLAISADELHLQRSSILDSLHRHTSVASDAETHHLRTLRQLQPRKNTLKSLEERWITLKRKFQQRFNMLSRLCTSIDHLIEISRLTEDFKAIWAKLEAGDVHRDILSIWENQITAKIHYAEGIFSDLEHIMCSELRDIFGRALAQFWGVSWTLQSALLLHKKFFREREALLLFSAGVQEKSALVKQRRDFFHSLYTSMKKPTGGFYEEGIPDTIRLIESKLKLIKNYPPCASTDFTQTVTFLNQTPLPLLNHADNPAVAFRDGGQHQRSSSVESHLSNRADAIIDLRTQRRRHLTRLHQQFRFDDIVRVHFIRDLKDKLYGQLGQLQDEALATIDLLRKGLLHQSNEVRYHEEFVSVLSMASVINSETAGIAHWLNQTVPFLQATTVSSILSEVIEDNKLCEEHWWEEVFERRVLDEKLRELEQRLQRKQQIKRQCNEFQNDLCEMLSNLLASPGFHRCRSDLDIAKSGPSLDPPQRPTSFCEPNGGVCRPPHVAKLFDWIARFLRRKLEETASEIDQILETANTRQLNVQNETDMIRGIQRCEELLAWINQSQGTLIKIESPFSDRHQGVSSLTAFDLSTGSEATLVSLEKELTYHTTCSLPVVQELETNLGQSTSRPKWLTLIEFTFASWNNLVVSVKMKRLCVDTAQRFFKFKTDVATSRRWIALKRELLLATGETKNNIGEMIRMECRMAGWEIDLMALTERVRDVNAQGETLAVALKDLTSPLTEHHENQGILQETLKSLEKWMMDLQGDWAEFRTLLEEYQKRLEASLDFQAMLQDLEAANLFLLSKQNAITALEPATSIFDIGEQRNVFEAITEELNQSKTRLADLLARGHNLVADQEYAVASAVNEKLHNLESGCSELEIVCIHHIESLNRQHELQIWLREVEALNVSVNRKENQIVQTDYMPTIEHIQGKLKTQTQVDASIKALQEQLHGLVVSAETQDFEEKHVAKLDAVSNRYHNLLEASAKVLLLLTFRLSEKENFQQLESVEEWILEREAAMSANFCETVATSKTTTTGAATKREKRAIQKYHIFRNFEAEVKSYEKLANKTFQDVQVTINSNPPLSDELQRSLNKNMSLWNKLKTTLLGQGSKLLEVYRAIIISEGCEELIEWLQKASVKIFGIQNCNYLKHDSPQICCTYEQAKRSFKSITDLYGNFARKELPSRIKRISVSETCLDCLSKSSGLAQPVDNFDLSGLNSALSNIEDLRGQLNPKRAFLKELEEHFEFLVVENEKFREYEGQLDHVQLRFVDVEKRLSRCHGNVAAHQKVISSLRTLGDEIRWLEEKRLLINVENTGTSLLQAQKLLVRHNHLTSEVKNRTKRNNVLIKMVTSWFELADALRTEGVTNSDNSQDAYCAVFIDSQPGLARNLFAKSSELVFRQTVVHRDLEVRHSLLEHWRTCFHQQLDLLEFYNWLIETESTVMTESHASSGIASATAAIQKHGVVEGIVAEFQAPRFRLLTARTNKLLSTISEMTGRQQERLRRLLQAPPAPLLPPDEARSHRHRLRRRVHGLERAATKLKVTQTSVQRQFTNLRDLVMEKKHRLHEILALNRLYEEVSDLEDWISTCIHEALTANTGRDLDECAHLQRDFVNLRRSILGACSDEMGLAEVDDEIEAAMHGGTSSPNIYSELPALSQLGELPTLPDSRDRLVRGITVARQMIALKHSDSPQIAQWLERLTEDWCDLRELMTTRGALLYAAGNRLLYLRRCEEVSADIREKLCALPVVLSADSVGLARQQRQLNDFRQSAIAIGERLNWVIRAANVLQPLYADTQATEMHDHRVQMFDLWRQLNETIEKRARILEDAAALSKWLSDLQHTLSWLRSTHEHTMAARKVQYGKELTENGCRDTSKSGLSADDERRSFTLKCDLSDCMIQHKELWVEICTWETCVNLQCLEGVAIASKKIIEEDDGFTDAPEYIGIHKMLHRYVQNLQTQHTDLVADSSIRDIREAALQQLGKSKKPTPAVVVNAAIVIVLVDLHQVKLVWRLYWRLLEQMTAMLELKRNIDHLDDWITELEENLKAGELGQSLEETLILTEEHKQITRVVAMQEDKFKHLADFQIMFADDGDGEWEAAARNELKDSLARLNVLPPMTTTPDIRTDQDAVIAEEAEHIEDDIIERMEGVVYRPRSLSHRSKGFGRWQKYFAVLQPSSLEVHFLEIQRTPHNKTRWISEKPEKDFILHLNPSLEAYFESENENFDGPTEPATFKIRNIKTEEHQIFKAQTVEQAHKWVSVINAACSKISKSAVGDVSATAATGAADNQDGANESRVIGQEKHPTLFQRMMSRKRGRKPRAHSSENERRRQQGHRRSRTTSDSDDFDVDDDEYENRGIKGLRLSFLLPSLSMTAMGTVGTGGSHSRAMAALTFPLRALRRHRIGQRLQRSSTTVPVIGGEITDNSNNGPLFEDKGDGYGDDGDGDQSERMGKHQEESDGSTDIDAVDEYS